MSAAEITIGGSKISAAHAKALTIAVATFHDELNKELGPDHTMRPTLARLADILELLRKSEAAQ